MCALLAGVIGVPVASASGRVAGSTQVSELPQLVRKAMERAEREYPGAVFYGANGSLVGPTVDPDDVREWAMRFVSREAENEFDFQYVYSPDGEYVRTEPWTRGLGIQPVEPFSMSQKDAAGVLSEAGYRGKFDQLYLSQPLVPRSEPIYYFCLVTDGQLAGVGTRTSRVYPDLFPCR
ncbi:hypothetical protein [Kutzneria sp. CA-103260]|uniref:hypothetical protein n=1 Tax=Kutzneria sp. CA-103260 TaxID=2802641 RepID=UPI001BAA1F66|nr:hypothetical protein [Kutzneria sp. CA-103260]QUQ62922.1 hypothetical protein JJ691_06340 [Kutzneria sp. CA-103260]